MRFHLRLVVILIVSAAAFTGACTTETHHGPAEIKVPDYSERYATESVHKVYHDGRHVGSAWRRRALDGDSNDYNDVRQLFVKNLNGDTVGFVTEENKAYRLRAHGDPEFVSNHPDLENNLLAVFGWNEGEIKLEKMTVPQD